MTTAGQNQTDAPQEQLVAFQLAGEIYALDIFSIHEIIRWRETTRIPGAAADVEGVVNLRGKIVPVVDLRRRLGLAETTYGNATRIIVAERDGCTVGLIVDSVIGVLRLNANAIESVGALAGAVHAEAIRGVGRDNNRLIILLDAACLLSMANGERP